MSDELMHDLNVACKVDRVDFNPLLADKLSVHGVALMCTSSQSLITLPRTPPPPGYREKQMKLSRRTRRGHEDNVHNTRELPSKENEKLLSPVLSVDPADGAPELTVFASNLEIFFLPAPLVGDVGELPATKYHGSRSTTAYKLLVFR
ncbi:hypothetical protein CBL_05704 [Carabus blaptoides fortunei]